MFKFIISLLFAATALFMVSCGESAPAAEETETTSQATTGNYTVDVANSVIKWKGTMLGIKYHDGTMKLREGQLVMNEGQVVGGSFTADLTTMVTTDDNYNEEDGSTPDKLLGHLASPDFFDVANHPTATFTINEGMGTSANGALTVRGNTDTEKINNIQVTEVDGAITASGTLTFDRKKYNVQWDSPMKEAVLSNDIELMVELRATPAN
jgi:polyisoprenoid-binding protein YceI